MSDLFDIAVIGAGPAGANAAMVAASAGARVVVLDEQTQSGGQVWRAKNPSILAAPTTPESYAGDRLRADLAASTVEHLGGARVWQIERTTEGWALHVLIGGVNQEIRSKVLILATGAREFVQPIPGWTTPSVIGLAGATALIKQDLTLPGKNTIVSGTGPLVFFVASELRRLGGRVAAVVTPNTRRDWASAMPAMMARPDLMWRGTQWIADLRLARVPILWGQAVTEVYGDKVVEAVNICKLNTQGAPIGVSRQIEADSLCLGNGLIPSIEAAQLAGVPLVHDPALGGWIPQTKAGGATEVAGLFVAGDGAGIRGAAAAEIHGQLAGYSAAKLIGKASKGTRNLLHKRYARAARFGMAMTALSIPKAGHLALATPKTIVCRCESLTRATIETEIASGAHSTNAVKSGLRAGMGPCGGKFCQSVIARMVAQTKGVPERDVPPPTPRPPLRPVPTSALAGDFDYDDLPIPKPAPL